MALNGTGSPATKDAKKLASKQYAERVLASLGEQRNITDNILRQFGEFDPENVSLYDLRRMRRDPMIKMGLYYAKAPQVRAKYTIKCEDPVIAAAMTEIVGQVRQSWMRTALNKYDFGYQGAVKSFKLGTIDGTYEDPETGRPTPIWPEKNVQPVVIGAPIPIPPELARVHTKDGQFNGIQTTFQTKGEEDESIIPVEWSLWFVNEFEEEFRNYYGVSRILPAYEPWYAYWFTHHMRSRHIEMDADPALQVWYPPGTYVDEDGQQKSNRDAALTIGASLRGGATIAWPSDVHIDEQGKATPIALWRAEFLKGGENLSAFNEVLGDLEIQKLRATLVPEEALVSTTGGLNSGMKASTYGQIFTESLEMESLMMDEIWTKHQIAAVVEANWGKDAPKCTLVTEGFQEEDLSLASELIKIAFNLDPNALPLKFEEIIDRLGLPQYTAAEQAEREEAAAEAKQQQMEEEAAQLEAQGGAETGQIGALPGETPEALAASQERHRTGPRKYEREVIHLSTVKSTAPDWARREGERRDRNVSAMAERMRDVMKARYADAFDAAADALTEVEDETLNMAIQESTDLDLSAAPDELHLALSDSVRKVLNRIVGEIKERVANYRRPVEAELASMYHVVGQSELTRLGLSADSWDVGRDEVQEWARWRAGELIKTIDKTVVEQHVRPWLASRLQTLGMQDRQGVAYGTLELAQELVEKFENYPLWMAERVVRSEARNGFNESALDMWERIGVQEVEAYDGLGGKSGQTDEHCLARNGQTFTIDEAREENRKEHPNGTLGFVPITADIDLRVPDFGNLVPNAAVSASIYGVTGDGLILSEMEVGALMVGDDK